MFPQVMKNVRVTDKKAVTGDAEVQKKISEIEEELGPSGRILLRESGTEPVIRVMVEAENIELCERFTEEVVALIKQRGLA